MDKKTIDHILNVLRHGTIVWEGRKQCLRLARKKVLIGKTKKGEPKYKLEWQCASCRGWFLNEKDLEVDHIKEVGPFSGNFDDYIRRLYCDVSNLQALCLKCHGKKTISFANARAKYRRNEDEPISEMEEFISEET